jgi:hypothetical protein
MRIALHRRLTLGALAGGALLVACSRAPGPSTVKGAAPSASASAAPFEPTLGHPAPPPPRLDPNVEHPAEHGTVREKSTTPASTSSAR